MKIDPLDRLYSEFIRRRAMFRTSGCEKCLRPKFDIQKEDGSILPAWKQLQCCHYHGRARRSVRWDPDDAAGLCGGCHMFLDSQVSEKAQWFESHLSKEADDNLYGRMRMVGKPDIEAIYLYLKAMIKELK